MAHLKSIFRPQLLRPLLSSQPSSTTTFFRPAISCSFSTSSTKSSSTPNNSAPTTTTRPRVPLIPKPTPFCPDVPTFLKLIGRGLSAHASKFPTWEALFSLTSEQLRELGVEPPRTRRYLLRWRQRFRQGQYGVGGEFKYVKDGKAHLRILEHAKDPLNPRRLVVNLPFGKRVSKTPLEVMSRVIGYKVVGTNVISGPYALPLKDRSGAVVTVTEGMWEDKRGHKIDGGERRRTQVRYWKRVQERREAREKGELR